VLEAGFRIALGITPVPFPRGVDTEQDLAWAQRQAGEGVAEASP
jgi:3-deoxy-manno-octulosonate cytidylyltransferase (CMP-KDO synthetase)